MEIYLGACGKAKLIVKDGKRAKTEIQAREHKHITAWQGSSSSVPCSNFKVSIRNLTISQHSSLTYGV